MTVRAADDFVAIRARSVELQLERETPASGGEAAFAANRSAIITRSWLPMR